MFTRSMSWWKSKRIIIDAKDGFVEVRLTPAGKS
jgi:hypothetical protein